MIASDYTLSRPVAVSIPAEEIDKLLRAGDGQCALVYLALQRAGGRPLRPGALGLTDTQLHESMEKLAALGLVSSGRRADASPAPLPAPDELPEYTAEDLVRRAREDLNFQSLIAFTEQHFGRKLTTPETKTLLGMQDYLGLPVAVLMELVTYVFGQFRAEKGPGRNPTMRMIEREAYIWAREELLTLELAESYIERQRQRQTHTAQLLAALNIDRAPSPSEKKYLTAWADMGFGPDAVREAYDRTTIGAGGLKWAYLNKILLNWHERGLHTLAEIHEGDPRGAKRRSPAPEQSPAAPRNDLALAEELLRRRKNGKE